MSFVKILFYTLCSLILISLAASESVAQSAVPTPKIQDTLESLNSSDAYRLFKTDSLQLTLQSQRSIDSLFTQEDQLQSSLRNAAKVEAESIRNNSEKTFKELKKEEKELQSVLKKENRKTDRWLNKGFKNGFKKTNYSEEELWVR